MRQVMTLTMAALWAAIAATASAADRFVSPSEGPSLVEAVAQAVSGDRIILRSGRYQGPLTLNKPVVLQGSPGAVVVGNGKGTVVTINAADVTLRGLEIRGSGSNLETMDSGVFATEAATGAVIENSLISENLYGIYIHGAKDSVTRGNRIVGIKEGRLSESGNGVTVWNAPGAKVVENDISFGRDGIATNASKRNVFSKNNFHDLRFAIHYMYTNDSEISGNVSWGNTVGYAIMFSNRLKIIDNVSDGDRDHGILLNSANSSLIEGNVVRGRSQPASRWASAGARASADEIPAEAASPIAAGDISGFRLGPEKCVFIYNANKNKLVDNEFNGCAIGIHFTAGSEGNTMSGNSFINNRNQVKYVGTRYLDWSANGRGNYWSDNPAFDLNGDGIGDNPYRPNDVMDKVLWTSPQAKLLATSPAVQLIRWAQAQFPALLPGGVIDNHPLMVPPAPSGALK
ncbi:nitrous oxide reductase family maturation protein NosD (plasmid) [Rhizobium grahamii]|uniref:Nitrous oxide reductase family maturation protein NosD n=2 Tax=Rhizobium/Agrobacterium group TaxID=227290 RepID=A0A5Q0CBF7_9HYPH|nr:nitrous oxide reductase family maturation protein NosD [Rhizobium grahamii]QRM52472.1 nitrous oxide reductase family maturation protein NosD [Rhizobium sp. BG6]